MRAITPATAGIVISLGLAACGSSTPGTVSAASKRSDVVAYAQCMRTHGVPNFPDPGINGQGGLAITQSRRAGSGPSLTVNGVAVSSPAFQSAMQSCRRYLPNGGHPPALSAARRQAMLRFSQCMRAHGVTNFPDPTFMPGGGARLQLSPASGIDPSSPVFQTAQKACAPAGKGGGAIVAAGP
jgi:hypothetical protein